MENGLHRAHAPLVVVVSADASVQLGARCARQHARREAQARIQAQAPLDTKLAVADFVIDNSDQTQDGLQERVQQVHEALLTRLEGKRS